MTSGLQKSKIFEDLLEKPSMVIPVYGKASRQSVHIPSKGKNSHPCAFPDSNHVYHFSGYANNLAQLSTNLYPALNNLMDINNAILNLLLFSNMEGEENHQETFNPESFSHEDQNYPNSSTGRLIQLIDRWNSALFTKVKTLEENFINYIKSRKDKEENVLTKYLEEITNMIGLMNKVSDQREYTAGQDRQAKYELLRDFLTPKDDVKKQIDLLEQKIDKLYKKLEGQVFAMDSIKMDTQQILSKTDNITRDDLGLKTLKDSLESKDHPIVHGLRDIFQKTNDIARALGI